MMNYRAVGTHSNTVLVVDRVKKILVRAIQVGAGARSLAITPDGSKIYVANASAHTVSIIDTRRGAVVKTLALGMQNRPTDVAVASNGLMAYATDNDAGTVSVIDVAHDVVAATIPVGILPTKISTLPRCSPDIVGSANGSIAYELGATPRNASTPVSDQAVALFDEQPDSFEE
jgi:YVTN family beta-propeller protein